MYGFILIEIYILIMLINLYRVLLNHRKYNNNNYNSSNNNNYKNYKHSNNKNILQLPNFIFPNTVTHLIINNHQHTNQH